MKHFGKMIFGAAMIASLAACTNETDFGQGAAGQVEEGIPTYARITLNVNQMGSRAGMSRATSISSGDESALDGGVRILVFNKSGVLETNHYITKDKINMTGASGVATEKVKTTTGAKTIYAIANPSSVYFDFETKTPSNLADFKNSIIKAFIQDQDSDTPVNKIAQAKQFFMTGFNDQVTLVKSTDQETKNQVTIKVTRLAAKAALKFDNNALASGANFMPANTAVTVTENDIHFQLAQNNKEFKIYVADGTFSPKGSDAEQPTSPVPALTYSHLTALDWNRCTDGNSAWVAALSKAQSFTDVALQMSNFAYTSENINQTPKEGNVTFAVIKVKLNPTKFTSNDGTQVGETFYAVVNNGGLGADHLNVSEIKSYYGIYKDETTANTAKAEAGNDYAVIKYTDGYAYYRLNLRDKAIKNNIINRYAVKRNHYFKITVDAINNPGVNKAEDLFPNKPDTPVEEEANIDATIEVLDWVDVNMTEPLG